MSYFEGEEKKQGRKRKRGTTDAAASKSEAALSADLGELPLPSNSLY